LKGVNTAGLAEVPRVAQGRDAADLAPGVPMGVGAELRRARAAGSTVALLMPNVRTRVVLPEALVTLVADALDAMSAGRGVALVVQPDALTLGSTDSNPCPYLILDRDPQDELTTQQAAAALRVSRPTIIKAIDDGRLAARKVGKHRRIRVYDFNAFARVDHGERARLASALSHESHATGDYHSLLPLPDADWAALKPRGVASSA
jgi:excisionase family DNA binding protein